MGTRIGGAVLAACVVASMLTGCSGTTDGCDDGGSCATAVGDSSGTPPTTTVLIGEQDLAAMMAVAVPAAVIADPDNGGDVNAQAYRIGDAFGESGDDQVIYGADVASSPIAPTVQTAISSALAPGWAQFVTAHPARGMLRIAMPERVGDDWQVVFEFFCSDQGALCGSGVTLQMRQAAGSWTVADVVSSWIS